METSPKAEEKTEELAGWQTGEEEWPARVKYRKVHPVFRGIFVLLFVLAALAGAAVFAYRNGIENMVFHPMVANPKLGHFYSSDTPEMSAEGIKGVITEAYYTYDRHFVVVLTLSNGLNTKQVLTSIDVTVKNEAGKTIASGSANTTPQDFSLKPMGTGTFIFYLSPQYVSIPNDDLGQLSYVITTTGKVEDVSALSTTTPSQTTGTTGTVGTTATTGAATITKAGTTSVK